MEQYQRDREDLQVRVLRFRYMSDRHYAGGTAQALAYFDELMFNNPETSALIQQEAAATEVEQYSAGIYDDAIATDLKTIEDATGHPIVELSQDDIDRIWAAVFEAKAASALAAAEPNGKTEGMTKILEAAAEFTGYDWQH